MKIAIFGGSFDPFHQGHRAILEAALASGKVKEIIVLPVGLAPHKKHYLLMSSMRLAMVRAAVADLDKVRVSDYEVKRVGVFSYTIDSIQALKKKLLRSGVRKVKLSLIYGSDVLDDLEKWYRPADILREARLLIALRGDDDPDAMEAKADYYRVRYGANIKFFAMPASELASRELRPQLEQGKVDPKAYPAAVVRFLERYQPYRFYADMSAFSQAELIQLAYLEAKIKKMMSEYRLLHAINVMFYAVHLARRHGIDPYRTAIAALLHDCCKELPIEEQLRYARKYSSKVKVNRNTAHGPAAAHYVRQYFNIHDREILAAIASHTTLHAAFTPLEAIVYLADKIEYSRRFKDLDVIRQTAEHSWEEAVYMCLKEVEMAMARQNKRFAKASRAALKTVQSALNCDKISKNSEG